MPRADLRGSRSITRSSKSIGGRCGRMRSSLLTSRLAPRIHCGGGRLLLRLGLRLGARFTATFPGIVALDQKVRKIVVARHEDHAAFAAFEDERVTIGLTYAAHDALHALDDLFGQLTFLRLQLALELHVGLLELSEGFLILLELLGQHLARQHVALLLEALLKESLEKQ